MRSRLLIFLSILLLLAGCATTRPASEGTACDCQRAVKVPDRAFRNWLEDKGYAAKAGWHRLRPTAKGCALTALECYNQGISTLEGIEMFPQLEQVTCSDNPLTALDLNALPRLQRLYGLNLPLQRIAIDSCHRLQHIELSHTRLDTFNLAPFPALEFFFYIFSPLRHLDLEPCPALRSLYLRGTQIHTVDLRPCARLAEVHILDTPMQTLIVTPGQYDGKMKVSVPDTVKVIVKDRERPPKGQIGTSY